MVKKGWVNVAYIVKCAVLYCEIISRTENTTKEKAERLFTQKGWKYEPNRGWVCPNEKKRHGYSKSYQ